MVGVLLVPFLFTTHTAEGKMSGPNDCADFSDFMWMENLEEFDQEIEQRLMEEEVIEMEWYYWLAEEEDYLEQFEQQQRDADFSSSVSAKTSSLG